MSSSSESEADLMPFALAISISNDDLITVLHMRNRLSRAPRLRDEGSPSSSAREVALELEQDLLDYLGPAEQTDAVILPQEVLSEDSAMAVEEDSSSVPLNSNPGTTDTTPDFTNSSSASSSASSSTSSSVSSSALFSHSFGQTAEDSDSDYDCDETIITNYCKLRAKGLIPATPPVTPRRVQ